MRLMACTALNYPCRVRRVYYLTRRSHEQIAISTAARSFDAFDADKSRYLVFLREGSHRSDIVDPMLMLWVGIGGAYNAGTDPRRRL